MTQDKLILIHTVMALILAGCQLEEIDQCPNNPDKLEAGTCGCEKPDTPYGIADTDGDYIQNCIDECPTDPLKTLPGFCGCNVKDTYTKLKDVPDCILERIDLCPDDPNKSWPGACGCGIPDADNNLNQQPDCIENNKDACPDDPDKTAPGVCGCGTPDTLHPDTGLPQCLGDDFCPDNPDKMHPGVCGCDMPDIDIDNDTIVDCALYSDANCQDNQTQCQTETQPLICKNGIWYNLHPCETDYTCKDGSCINETIPSGPCGPDIPKCIDNIAYICEDEIIVEKDCGSKTCYQGECVVDHCPDSEKVEPGICGCHLPDIDSDRDGVLDCKDFFPHDPNKTECEAPYIKVELNGQPYCGYAIKETKDFLAFRDAWNAGSYENAPVKTWILTQDITLNSFADDGNQEAWEGVKNFSGDFIADGKSISFVQDGYAQYINCQQNECGLFASITGTENRPARVSGLKLQYHMAHHNTNATQPAYTGILAGQIHHAHVSDIVLENINVKTPQSTAGCLIGYAENSQIESVQIQNSYIEALSDMGGLVGSAKNITVKDIKIKDLSLIQNQPNCSNLGGITGKSENSKYRDIDIQTTIKNTVCTAVGGIIGHSLTNTIQSAKVTGTINEKKYVGGIIGKSELGHSDTISDAQVAVSTTANQFAGGIIGYANAQTTLDQVTCTSDITSGFSVGGLIAVTNDAVVIKNSQYRGAMSLTSSSSCETSLQDEDLKGGKKAAGGIIGNYLANSLELENITAETQMDIRSCTGGGIIGYMNMNQTAGLTRIENAYTQLLASSKYSASIDTYLGGVIGEIVYQNIKEDTKALRAINLNKLYTYLNISLNSSTSSNVLWGGIFSNYDATGKIPAGKQFTLPMNLSNTVVIANASSSSYGGGITYQYQAKFREKKSNDTNSSDFFPTLTMRNISINILQAANGVGLIYHYNPDLSSINNVNELERYYNQYPHQVNNGFINQHSNNILFQTYNNYLQLKNTYNRSTQSIASFCHDYQTKDKCAGSVVLPETNAITGGFTDPALAGGSIIDQLNQNITSGDLNPAENEKWIMLETTTPDGTMVKFPGFEFVKTFIK